MNGLADCADIVGAVLILKHVYGGEIVGGEACTGVA
jgi:hypothetical protein